MNQASTASRRAILAGIIGAPALAATGALAATTPSPGSGSDFAQVVATWKAAHDKFETYSHGVLETAEAAYEAERAKIPHETARKTVRGNVTTLSTANSAHVSIARAVKKHPGDMSGLDTPEMRQLIAALERREQAAGVLYDKHNLRAINDENDRLCTLDVETWNAVIDYPVSTVAEAHEKLSIGYENQFVTLDEIVEVVLGDLQRIAGRA